ncbi:MAG: putative MccF-like protein (microcin resistance) [Bacteroidetes bacterium]|jgi:muramoyltetrapeptide carboxypeptidase|nr:putative MccF-like protein (microcin resistance) [Bacteroidota bacterium]
MIVPSYLKKGDRVAIIATARKVSKEEIQPAVAFFESYGLLVSLGKNLFESSNQYAGTDTQRTEDLQWALNDPEIKAIIIARGGYGSVRVLEQISFTEFKKHPKWMVGYSDVTVFHNAIHNIGVATLHATMPLNFTKNTEATQSMMDALLGNLKEIATEENYSNREGMAKGQLIGGNLSLLYSLSGTPYDIDTKGKILFIEDLDEYLYHIDRMMMQLKLSGKLKNLNGLIVGGMTDMKDNAIPFGKFPEDIILDAVKEYNYPVCFDFPAGHIDRNLAIYFGKEVELKVEDEKGVLKFL